MKKHSNDMTQVTTSQRLQHSTKGMFHTLSISTAIYDDDRTSGRSFCMAAVKCQRHCYRVRSVRSVCPFIAGGLRSFSQPGTEPPALHGCHG